MWRSGRTCGRRSSIWLLTAAEWLSSVSRWTEWPVHMRVWAVQRAEVKRSPCESCRRWSAIHSSSAELIGSTLFSWKRPMAAFVSKVGAEGVHSAVVLDRGIGVALKVEDGNCRRSTQRCCICSRSLARFRARFLNVSLTFCADQSAIAGAKWLVLSRWRAVPADVSRRLLSRQSDFTGGRRMTPAFFERL